MVRFDKLITPIGEVAMRFAGSISILLAAVLFAGPVIAQQAAAPSPAVIAERDAGTAAIVKAEKLLNGGEKRGPNSEACASMNEALLHYVKGAAEAGAQTRSVGWLELTLAEQAAVKEKIAAGPWERNIKLYRHACTEAP
jgi:hypothetical protein